MDEYYEYWKRYIKNKPQTHHEQGATIGDFLKAVEAIGPYLASEYTEIPESTIKGYKKRDPSERVPWNKFITVAWFSSYPNPKQEAFEQLRDIKERHGSVKNWRAFLKKPAVGFSWQR